LEESKKSSYLWGNILIVIHYIHILNSLGPNFGFGFASMNCVFFFFWTPGNELIYGEKTENAATKILDRFEGIYSKAEAKDIIMWTLHDGFNESTETKRRNQVYIVQLKKLKQTFIDFYLSTLTTESEPNTKYNCDIHSRISNYMVQIMRLRMVVEPEIQLTVNVHKKTQIIYLTVKGFWLNDEGIKDRRFIKSLGRVDSYELGKDDPRAIEEGEARIQELVYDEYLNNYP